MDARLRDLLTTAVGDPPHRVTAETVRRRVVRRRRAEWATGTAAVVLLTGLGIVVPGQLFAPGGTSRGSSAPTGAPRYYLQTIATQPGQQVTVVRATATGAVTARVNCPWPKSYPASEGLAPADGQTFFLACQRSHGIQHFVVTGTRIYRFQLTGSGRIPGYSLVPGGDLGAVQVGRMTATPDGTQLAVNVTPGKRTTQAPPSIQVVNTQTGARAVWHNGTGAPGTTQYGIGDLSWTRTGRKLVFQVTTCKRGGVQCASGAQWRVLRRPATGGDLDSSKLLLLKSSLTGHAQGYINDSVITPDGSALIVVALHSPHATPGNIDVVKVDPATGHPIRVLFQENTGNGVSYGSFSSDPSTRFLILNAGPPQGGTHNGWIDHGRLVTLKPANGSNVVFETW